MQPRTENAPLLRPLGKLKLPIATAVLRSGQPLNYPSVQVSNPWLLTDSKVFFLKLCAAKRPQQLDHSSKNLDNLINSFMAHLPPPGSSILVPTELCVFNYHRTSARKVLWKKIILKFIQI